MRHLIGDYLEAVARRHRQHVRPPSRAAGGDGVRRRWHAVARSAARCWPACWPRSRSRPAPRSRSSATPTTSPTSCSPPTPPAGSTASASACSRWCRGCWRCSGAGTIPTTSWPPCRRSGDVGFASFNIDLIYGAASETLDEWRTTLRRRTGARPAARVGVRAHRRGRHAARRRPGPPSRRRRAGRRVRARRRPAHRRRPRQLRGVELGPAGPREPSQPALLGPARLLRVRLRRPLPPSPGGGGGTCARPSATSPPSAPARRTEAAGETLDDDTRRVEGLQLSLRTTPRRARSTPSTATRSSTSSPVTATTGP